MTDGRQKSSGSTQRSADSVVGHLTWRYLFVLAIVAALMVVDQAIIQPMLVRVNAFAPAINVAGRQRMLSQKLTKASLALRDARDDSARSMRREELRQALAQWTAEHRALLEGDAELGIQPIRTVELVRHWEKLQPHYQAMVTAAGELIEASGASDRVNAISPSVAAIVTHEAEFLPTMDRIVKLMEDEAADAVTRLRTFALAIAATVIVLLIGLGWFVVRPATRTIRAQIVELESRITQRTGELATALESLQREVRERELAECNNQRLSAQLAHAERVTTMGHLTAGLAHELNQPLAAIANYTEACDVLLQSPHNGEADRVREFVLHAKRAALRAGQIVRRMRNYVRPNAASASEIRINELVTEFVELCRVESTNAGVQVSLVLAAGDDAVCADPIQIQQVLVNLVQNALQAMRNDGRSLRQVIIRTTTVEPFVQVDVLDTGPGFASTDADVVFAPFRTTKQDGLGIGLSICRSIVENHRGTIWIESRPKRGAQVSFNLPLATAHARRWRVQPDRVCR